MLAFFLKLSETEYEYQFLATATTSEICLSDKFAQQWWHSNSEWLEIICFKWLSIFLCCRSYCSYLLLLYEGKGEKVGAYNCTHFRQVPWSHLFCILLSGKNLCGKFHFVKHVFLNEITAIRMTNRRFWWKLLRSNILQ